MIPRDLRRTPARPAGLTARRVRWSAAGLAVAAAIVAACTSGGGSGPDGSAAKAGSAGTDVATRWWSNDAAVQGSRIDPAKPADMAARLAPSEKTYCSMLRQTLAAGRRILPDAKAGNAALVTSTAAFLAEIERVAPVAVADDWQTLAPTLLAVVEGKQLPANTSAAAKANLAAAKAVSADARTSCGLTLSAG